MFRLALLTAALVFASGCGRSNTASIDAPHTRSYPAPGPISDQWIAQLGAPNGATYSYGIALDRDGNVYASGSTTAGLNGNAEHGLADLFAVKYDRTGSIVWAQQLGAPNGTTVSTAATVDHTGNLCIAGYTNAALGRAPQAGTNDVVVVKYDSLGELLWVRQLGSSGSSIAQGIATDGSNIYVSGYTTDALPGAHETGAQDFFLAKLSSTGKLLWIRQLGAVDEYAYGYRVAVDSSGSAFVAGYTTAPLDGNRQASHDSAFLAKFSPRGQLLWIRQLDGASAGTSTFGYGVAIDNGDNAYLAGSTTAALPDNLQFGDEDLYVAKYNSSGELIWASQYGSNGGRAYGHDIAIDQSNGIYITGTTNAALGLNTQTGRQDIFVGQFDVSGDLIRLQQTGAAGGTSSAFAIAVNDLREAFLAGTTAEPLGSNTQAGAFDLFIAQFRSR
jgi:hypothetical protein